MTNNPDYASLITSCGFDDISIKDTTAEEIFKVASKMKDMKKMDFP